MLAGQTQPVKPRPVGKVLQTTGKKIPQEGNDLMVQSLKSFYHIQAFLSEKLCFYVLYVCLKRLLR